MYQLTSFAADRLLRGCIFCGGPADTRDHIPSKCLLDKPFPENLAVMGYCYECNQSFSSESGLEMCRESGQHGKTKRHGTLHIRNRGTGILYTQIREPTPRGREPSAYPLVCIKITSFQ